MFCNEFPHQIEKPAQFRWCLFKHKTANEFLRLSNIKIINNEKSNVRQLKFKLVLICIFANDILNPSQCRKERKRWQDNMKVNCSGGETELGS